MKLSSVFLAGCLTLPAVSSFAGEYAKPRGETVFQAHCARCHGEQGDGNSAIAKVLRPKPPNLLESKLDLLAKEKIVTEGGAGVGRSPVMPAWKDELTVEQIHDVVAFIHAKADSAKIDSKR